MGRQRGDRSGVLLVGIGVLAALVATGLVSLLSAPVAWLWLAICAGATVPVVVWFAARGRLFEPLPLFAAISAVMFVARPLQLILEWRDLYSHFFARDPVNSLVLLETQEVALFVGQRLDGSLETAIARALGACALFLVCLLVGYRFLGGAQLARRLVGLGRRTAPRSVSVVVAISLAIGLAAQVAVIAKAGGPGASLESASEQKALSESFVLFLLSGFSYAALAIWVAWRPPRSRLEWAALLLSLTAVCAFAGISGSRSRVFIALIALGLIVHHLHRRWRPREVVLAIVVLLGFGSFFVVFRQVAHQRSLSEARQAATEHVLDARVIANDISYFDDVLYATTIYGETRPHRHGGFLLDSVRSYIPRRIDSGKPEGGDIVFRKVVWKNQFLAGRPPTAVGDLFIDFGLPGVALGALLFGLAARALIGLLDGGALGREYRVALYAILLIVLYEWLVGTLSIAVGFVLTLLLPFLVAVHGFGRLPPVRAFRGRVAAQ
jgi:oligosaccharide repeat unit polymerase